MTDQEALDGFKGKFSAATEAILDASRFYVQAITEKPERAELFREAMPMFTETRWRLIENIGRGNALPDLFTAPPSVLRQLEAMPISAQQVFSAKGAPLLLPNGDSINVTMGRMTPEQARQLVAYDHVRTLAEQKVWLEKEKHRAVTLHSRRIETGYKIEKGQIVITSDGTLVLTRKQLLAILAEMG